MLKIDPSEIYVYDTIGEGTSATVYMARYDDERQGEVPVAVKELHAGRFDFAIMQAVRRELHILIQVEHPNIVRLIGVVNQAEPLRLVLEYCAGGSLFELLHNCYHIPLSWTQRLQVLAQTAQGMEYLHDYDPPIIHRDLKSPNLMLKEEVTSLSDVPAIKLADFGFARPSHTSMTQGVGTTHWMAPEVLQGTDYTEKVDIFSFAMVAFEVVYRVVPFEEHDPRQVSTWISQGTRPELIMCSSPPELLELVRLCWDQDPAARPTSGEILGRARALLAREGAPVDT